MESFAHYDAMVHRFFPDAPGWVRVNMLDDDLDVVYKTRATGVGEMTTTMVFDHRVLRSVTVVFDKAWATDYTAGEGCTLSRFYEDGSKEDFARVGRRFPPEPVFGVPKGQWDVFRKMHAYHASLVQ